MKKFISILLVFALALSLFAGSALAANGPVAGNFSDFPWFFAYYSSYSTTISPVKPSGGVTSGNRGPYYIIAFPSSLSSSSNSTISPQFFQGYTSISITSASLSNSSYGMIFFDSYGNTISSGTLSSLGFSATINSPFTLVIPAGTQFIYFRFPTNYNFLTDYWFFSDFYYDDVVVEGGGSGGGSGSGYDPSLDQDILDAVVAIAQSLSDLETGPYSGVTNITPNYDANGNFTDNTLTVSNNATLTGLLNALGISSTSSALYLKNLYDNWGNNFTYYLMDTPVSGGNLATEMVESVEYDLPTYIATFGQDLSYAVQQMRRENYAEQQTWTQRYQWLYDRVDTLESTLSTDINNALYAETDTTPAETWSVAQWLKGIYNSVTSFFSSFWSPAETAIKEANEDAMQATVTNDVHTTTQNVNDFASMQSAVTGFLPSGDISGFNSLNDTAFYSFWSAETHKAMLPPDDEEEEPESLPSNSRRLLSASPPSSAPVVDYGAFDRNQALYQSLLGGG